MSNVDAPSPSNVIAAGVVWPLLCAIVVALRFYTRRVQGARLLLDDWMTIPALVLTFGLGAALVYGVHSKGLAYPNAPPANPHDALTNNSPQVRINRKLVWSFQLVQLPALACVKLSFIFFYRRVFCTGVGNIFRTITTATNILITVWAIAFEFTFLFVCKGHFSAWWTSIQSLDEHCHAELDLELAFSSTDFITDVIVILLPLPLIWRLQMSVKRRLAVIAIFCLGALTVATSITRMVIFIRAVQSLKKAYVTSGANDLTTTAGLYWSMNESGLGLAAACLPTIYGLLKQKSSLYKTDADYRKRGNSMSSDIRMVAGVNGAANIDTHALKELDPVLRNGEPQNGQIFVQKSIQTIVNVA